MASRYNYNFEDDQDPYAPTDWSLPSRVLTNTEEEFPDWRVPTRRYDTIPEPEPNPYKNIGFDYRPPSYPAETMGQKSTPAPDMFGAGGGYDTGFRYNPEDSLRPSPTRPSSAGRPQQALPDFMPKPNTIQPSAQPSIFTGDTGGKTDWSRGLGDFGASQMAATATREDVMPQPNGRTPQYDYGPMQRYQQYLKDEPQRENYRPGKLGGLINIASAGLEGYRTGDVGRAVKLGEYLNDKPYQRAVEGWKGRGGRYESDVRFADTRYKTETEAANKREDNRRADYLSKLTERGVEVREATLLWQINKAQDEGYTKFTAPDGTIHMQKVVGGQMRDIPTGMPATEYTVAQRQAEAAGLEKGRMYRHVTPSGSSVYSAGAADARQQTGIGAALEQQRRGFEFTGAQNSIKERGINERAGMVPGVAGATRPVARLGEPTASALSRPETAITQAYKEFNSPEVIKMTRGPKGEMSIAYEDDPEKVKAFIRKASGGNMDVAKRMWDRWGELTNILNASGVD